MSLQRGLYAQNTFKFPAGNDVETGACAFVSDQAQNGQRGVGFYRIADRVWDCAKSFVESVKPRANCFRRINIKRRAVTLGKMRKVGLAAKKR